MNNKMNVGEKKTTKWMLNIKKLLSSFNSSLVDGLISWKNNLDKEFEGIEVERPNFRNAPSASMS